MDIKRSDSQPSTKGSAEYFTGSVRIDPLFQANAPARAVGANVDGISLIEVFDIINSNIRKISNKIRS